jgi:O-antigen ligase
MISVATAAVIAWGALAFGAVYPWAFQPLLAACAMVGVLALVAYRHRPMPRSARPVLWALICVLVATALQVVPMPPAALAVVSPSTDAFLRTFDLSYALGGLTGPDGAVAPPAWRPVSIAPAKTLVALGFIGAFTLFLAGLVRALSPERARRLAALIVAFGVVLALVGIVQKALLGDHAWAGMKIYGFWAPANLLSTPFGPYVNKNHFAGWMLMAVPLALGLGIGTAEQALRRRGSDWRLALLWLSSPAGGRAQMALIAAFIMAASLLMTRSRSGVGCLGVAMVFMSIAARRRFGSARAGWAALASMAALFLIVFALAGAELTARIANRMDAMELRKNIWTDSATIIGDFPVTGTGLNTFGTAMISYQTSQTDQHFQEAHNDYLQVLVEGGLLVGLPALVALVFAVRAIRRRFDAADDDAVTYWMRAGAAVGLMAIGLQAVVEFSLQMPGNAALFVVLLAIAMHSAAHRRAVHPRAATETSS